MKPGTEAELHDLLLVLMMTMIKSEEVEVTVGGGRHYRDMSIEYDETCYMYH
jgi:hypothetical protein